MKFKRKTALLLAVLTFVGSMPISLENPARVRAAGSTITWASSNENVLTAEKQKQLLSLQSDISMSRCRSDTDCNIGIRRKKGG